MPPSSRRKPSFARTPKTLSRNNTGVKRRIRIISTQNPAGAHQQANASRIMSASKQNRHRPALSASPRIKNVHQLALTDVERKPAILHSLHLLSPPVHHIEALAARHEGASNQVAAHPVASLVQSSKPHPSKPPLDWNDKSCEDNLCPENDCKNLKSNYRTWALRVHPDKNHTDPVKARKDFESLSACKLKMESAGRVPDNPHQPHEMKPPATPFNASHVSDNSQQSDHKPVDTMHSRRFHYDADDTPGDAYAPDFPYNDHLRFDEPNVQEATRFNKNAFTDCHKKLIKRLWENFTRDYETEKNTAACKNTDHMDRAVRLADTFIKHRLN